MRILGVSESEAAEICGTRLSRIPMGGQLIGELLQLDELTCCLDKFDLELVKDEKNREVENVVVRENIIAEFKEYKRSTASASGSKRSKSSVPWKGPKERPKAQETVTQPELKPFLPPGALIWLNRTGPTWCARLLQNDIIYKTWKKEGGEVLAGWACIRECWIQYLDGKGLGSESCPIKGLF